MSCCGNRTGGVCCSTENTTDGKEDTERKAKTDAVVREILDKTKTVLDVVEGLGPQLTDRSVNERVNAVNHLTDVIVQLPRDFLIAEEVSTLLTFFIARLQDSILLLSPTLKSIHYLISSPRVPTGVEQNLLTALFKEVNVQSGAQEDRYHFYQILEFFVKNRLEDVKSMGVDFILGFIQGIEGEKDPRCLLLVFDLFRTICLKVPLHHLADDMFEVVACYFPIIFEPPPDDPIGITCEDLSGQLRRCMTAHSKFASLCMQLLDEHFREESTQTKMEAFLLLDEAIQQFPAHTLQEWATTLWNEIRKQVMTPRNSELEEKAITCLQHLVEAIAKCTEDDGRNSNLVVLIGQIFRDCEPFLSNPEMQLLQQTNRILISAAKGDPRVADQIANRALPLCMEKYQNKETSKKDYALLLLQWCRVLVVEMESSIPLFTIQDAFTNLLIVDMLTGPSELVGVALQISTCLLEATDDGDAFLSDDQCVKIGSIALQTNVNPHSSSMTYLRTLSTKRWTLVEKELVPPIVKNMDDSNMLSALSCLVTNSVSADVIIPLILYYFDVKERSGNGLVVKATNALRSVLQLNSCQVEGSEFGKRYTVVEGIVDKHREDVCRVIRSTVGKLAGMVDPYEVLMESKPLMESQPLIGGNSAAFVAVCDLVQDFLLYSCIGNEIHLLDVLLSDIDLANLAFPESRSMLLYVERIVAAMTAQELEHSNIAFWNFSSNMTHLDDQMIAFWNFCSNMTHLDDQMTAFLNFCSDMTHLDDQQRHCVLDRLARITACAVNKMPQNYAVKVIDEAVNGVESTLVPEKIERFAWLCKAILLRNLVPYADRAIEKMFEWLGNKDSRIPAAAVRGLEIILDDDPEAPLLSQRTGVHTTILAKQRISSRCVALLTQGFQNCQSEDAKVFYFQALRIVLSYVPKTPQCKAEMDKLLPLLYNSILSDDQAVLSSSVESLKQLITSSNTESIQQLHPHVPTLCSRLVEIAKSGTSAINLRASALECITAIASANRIPAVILYPWRDKILKELASCLDDRKRLVRSKAVMARNQWFML